LCLLWYYLRLSQSTPAYAIRDIEGIIAVIPTRTPKSKGIYAQEVMPQTPTLMLEENIMHQRRHTIYAMRKAAKMRATIPASELLATVVPAAAFLCVGAGAAATKPISNMVQQQELKAGRQLTRWRNWRVRRRA
jgi:hypothetical protein